MKSFEELCQTIKENNSEITTVYNEAKAENKKRNKVQLISCLIIDASILLIAFLINGSSFPFLILPILAPMFIIDIFIIIITSFVFNKKQKEYRTIYKNQVMKSLVENFYENAEYFPYKGMPSSIYREGIYESYDNYYSDDYIETTIDGKYLMDMAEVHTEEEHTSTDSNGNTTTTTTTLFHGLFAKITLDKSIGCTLRITQGSNWDTSKDRLKMDSSEFEKLFNVYTSNSIVGMQILTSDIMEEILAFQKKTKYAFDIYIRANDVYLRFRCGTMFEVKSFKNGIIDEKSLRYYYDVLDFIKCFTDEIIGVIQDTEL